MASNRTSYKERIEELESICLSGKTFPSTETDEDMFVTSDFLLDTLMCLYYECNMPAFRSLKNSQKFQESGELYLLTCFLRLDSALNIDNLLLQ